MKKNILSLFVVGVLVLVLILFITQPRKKPDAVGSLKHSTIALEEYQKSKPRTIISQKTKVVPQQPTEMFFKEFSLPQGLEEELSEAERNGKISDGWGEGRISKEELRETGLAPGQLLEPGLDNKIRSITAGYSLPDKALTEILKKSLPDEIKHPEVQSSTGMPVGKPEASRRASDEVRETEDATGYASDESTENEQTRILNSEALAAMGFSALMEDKHEQAKEAFMALIRDYADTQAAPIVHLELARLFSEEGRFREAQELIDKAASLYDSDKEYLAIAQALNVQIQLNEQENRLRR